MSVYIPRGCKTYVYDFWLFTEHYKKSTGQVDEALAQKVEDDLKATIRAQRAGVFASPRFSEWAGVYYRYVVDEQQLKRPDAVDFVLRVLLRFCGARPADGGSDVDPYYDLTLQAFIDEPDWILKFEDWMTRRGISRGTKHHYRTYMSRMYLVARLPMYRKFTGVQEKQNPFEGIPRGKKTVRKVTLSVDELLRLQRACSYHVRLAIAIASLSPMFRLHNVLSLRFDQHFDETLRWITVDDHKTDGSGEPLVAPIPDQLRIILLDGQQRATKTKCPYVVQHRGHQVKTITNGIRAGFERAGIPYGRYQGGATFHTIRHSISTLMPQLGVNPWLHQNLFGWADIQTAMTYTHLRPVHLVAAAEQLSAAVPMWDAVTAPGTRPQGVSALSGVSSATPTGKPGGPEPRAQTRRHETPMIPLARRTAPGRPFTRKS